MEKGGKAADEKKFFSCRHEPIVGGSGQILGKFSIAPLHLFLGFTNKLIIAVQKEFKEGTEKWLKSLHVFRAPQHGGENFNGPDCR